MTTTARAALQATIDTIESSYEFMLAYAAQGRDEEQAGAGPSIRRTLLALNAALDAFGTHAAAAGEVAAGEAVAGGDARAAFAGFLEVVRRDVTAARAAIRLVLAVPSIGSQLVDNLNASIHLRAVLTDLFLLDETLKSLARAPGAAAG